MRTGAITRRTADRIASRVFQRVRLPGQQRANKAIDLFVGPCEPFSGRASNWQPTPDAPVFEFKMVRDDDWPDKIRSVHGDVRKLRQAELVNGYAFLLYRLGELRDLEWRKGDLRERVSEIEPLAADGWGPQEIDLTQHLDEPGQVCFYVEAFRVVAKG